ncbi:MAG: capsular polysaccharide biosynthesis protein [Pseudomonadota bacterium]
MKGPKLFVYGFGLIAQPRVRAVLRVLGYRLRIGLPLGATDKVLAWGRKSAARRSKRVARIFGKDLVTIEDAFLRSVRTGREGEPALGLIVDHEGIYFDATQASEIQTFLDEAAQLTPKDLQSARDGLALMQVLSLSKYNNFPMKTPVELPRKFVLVVDQTQNDMSIVLGHAGPIEFQTMLADAKRLFPDHQVVIKAHPETLAKTRSGHFDKTIEDDRIRLLTDPVNPWTLLRRADAVFVVTSQLGMEAIFAGHKPYVYGTPFYAGRGLTHDQNPDQKQRSDVTREQLFHAAMERYTQYYDPFQMGLTDIQGAMYLLSAKAQAQRQFDRAIFFAMRLWKRGFMRRYLAPRGSIFSGTFKNALGASRRNNEAIYAWASKIDAVHRDKAMQEGATLVAVEDGFIRSKGLGAELVPPVSLCLDWRGIYFDPERESDCERMIATSVNLPAIMVKRATRLRQRIVCSGISKYNLGGASGLGDLPTDRQIILVPGQVEDDASIVRGSRDVRTNSALLRRVRADFPNAYIVYKPHPDVVAGLRDGEAKLAPQFADLIVQDVNIAALLSQVDMVATITSLTGFEALLRNVRVVCYGAPFYAGWGLTEDRAWVPDRRLARPSLDQLVHAVLIDYAWYWDPITREACPPETVLWRLETGSEGHPGGPFNRLLSKAQGLMISFGPFWR